MSNCISLILKYLCKVLSSSGPLAPLASILGAVIHDLCRCHCVASLFILVNRMLLLLVNRTNLTVWHSRYRRVSKHRLSVSVIGFEVLPTAL